MASSTKRLALSQPAVGASTFDRAPEALDDHRHPGGQREIDQQLFVVGLEAPDGPLGQVGDGARVGPARGVTRALSSVSDDRREGTGRLALSQWVGAWDDENPRRRRPSPR